ncbi:MAG: NAD(+) synthase [Planctomycetales bacterium]|nr:NAD(+) synthase [Planctomycetales bacterium]
MKTIRLGAACLNQTPLAWEENCEHILAAIAAAREVEVAVLCLPELCISGYGCEDTFFATGVQDTALEVLAEIVPATTGMVVSLGLPLKVDGVIFNACALACDGKLLGFVGKQFLAGDGIHYEPRWFKPWAAGEVREVAWAGKPLPIGDLLFDCGGVVIGMEICRDAWVDNRPGRQLAARGADILLNPSASHFAFAKQEIRRGLVLDGSREFHVSYAYANLLGNESGRAIFDGGTLLASRGEMLAVGPRFSFADYRLATADVDIEATRRDRAESGRARRAGATVENSFQLPRPSAAREPTQADDWDSSPPPKEEEFARAVPLALFDYLRKSQAGGVVVSLSGGADSAAVATMVWLMVQTATAEVGRSQFVGKLSCIAGLDDALDSPALTRRILSCVYQATRNSSETTFQSAKAVAEAIGAEFLHWNVDAMVDGYVELVSQAVGRKLSWEQDDLALQNIQARSRGPGAWLVANLRGALLLATSNRSEAAVGYATMDGDTCGGLSPIAGIDKAFLIEWLRWMETTGPAGVGPLPALAAVNRQQPTAELRPPSHGQTDEGDLMPYRVLDAIERAAIRDRLMPLEVYESVRKQLKEVDPTQLGQWVERFFRLWCRNQWKRERYAPSFHLDDENLDPKTWCRFPILSGGFERELEELRECLQ